MADREIEQGPAAFRVTDARQLTAETMDVSWLDPSRMGPVPALPPEILQAVHAGTLTAVNVRHPCWKYALEFTTPDPPSVKMQAAIIGAGDVGGTVAMALKLLGGDRIARIAIHDPNDKAAGRWKRELGQIAWPWDYGALPEVSAEQWMPRLFSSDVIVFTAAKSVPEVGSGVEDVRMAQLEANRPLVEHYARLARGYRYRGLFIVMSDPVDPLCKAAYQASNRDRTGNWDGKGLLPEQIQGFGLGVMNARAAYHAEQTPRYRDFLREGRSFGPHGQGLVIANSIGNYDDEISRELTDLTLNANLRIRKLGFKPYVAPAVSSGAMQLLLTLRGEWHCSSLCLGGVWFGAKNRFTPHGIEWETLSLPEALFSRLRETEAALHEIG